MLLQMHFINLSGDSPYRPAIFEGDPTAPPGMLEEVIMRRETLALLKIQRGNPGWI
jgi:hypothetical protein